MKEQLQKLNMFEIWIIEIVLFFVAAAICCGILNISPTLRDLFLRAIGGWVK